MSNKDMFLTNALSLIDAPGGLSNSPMATVLALAQLSEDSERIHGAINDLTAAVEAQTAAIVEQTKWHAAIFTALYYSGESMLTEDQLNQMGIFRMRYPGANFRPGGWTTTPND